MHRVPVEIRATKVRARSACVGVGIFTSYSGSGALARRPGVLVFAQRHLLFSDRSRFAKSRIEDEVSSDSPSSIFVHTLM